MTTLGNPLPKHNNSFNGTLVDAIQSIINNGLKDREHTPLVLMWIKTHRCLVLMQDP